MVFQLPSHLVEEIKRQVALGSSYRKIAESMSVSRQSVSTIANEKGRYTPGGGYDCRNGLEQPENRRSPSKVSRCSGCGAMVEIPCRACALTGGE